MTETACIFCRIVEGREKASFVAQGSDAVAFLDLHPINEGPTLVVPRKHAASVSEVEEVAAVAMWSLAGASPQVYACQACAARHQLLSGGRRRAGQESSTRTYT